MSNNIDDLDPQFRALVVAPRGGVDVSEIQTTRITIEPFILAVYPKVHVMDVATRRWDRTKPTLKNAVCWNSLRAQDTYGGNNSRDWPISRKPTKGSSETIRVPSLEDRLEDRVRPSPRCEEAGRNDQLSEIPSQGNKRVGILDREQQKAQIEMAGLEDDKIFAAFKNQNLSFTDPVNNGVINALITGNTGLTPDIAAQAFAAVEQYDSAKASDVVRKPYHLLETPAKPSILVSNIASSENYKDRDNQQETRVVELHRGSSETVRREVKKVAYDIVRSVRKRTAEVLILPSMYQLCTQ